MSETSSERVRERDFDRFLTFVDAIVAIAITLLVLPLVDIAGELGDGSVADLLDDNAGRIGAFLLSFVVIANLWLVQHRVLTHVVAADVRLTRLLLLWTLTIVFLPFPTALVAQSDAGEQSLTKVLYVGCMTVSSLVLALICVVIDRGDRLRDSADGPDATRAFATFATFVVILAVMLLFPSTSYWPLLLLLVPDRALALWRRRASGQQPQV
jgi:TMEM175 potassium channel family protein